VIDNNDILIQSFTSALQFWVSSPAQVSTTVEDEM